MFESLRLRKRPRSGPRFPSPAAWITVLLLSAPLVAGAVVTVSFTSIDLTDVVVGQDLRANDYVISGGFSDGATLTLDFPATAYAQLDVPVPPAAGAPATLLAAPLVQPNAGSGDSGLLMLTAPTALPTTFQDSLRVSFVSLAGGSPGTQTFDVVDSGFATVQPTSFTVAAAAVPEPAAGVLFAVGLALLAMLRRSSSSRGRSPQLP